VPGATNGKSYFGSPLGCAATIGDIALIRILLESDVGKTSRWRGSWAAAAEYGHFELLRFLIDSKRPNLNYQHYQNALQHASRGGHIEIVRFLFENADILLKKPTILPQTCSQDVGQKIKPKNTGWKPFFSQPA
jgi:ankyrin repeat protein